MHGTTIRLAGTLILATSLAPPLEAAKEAVHFGRDIWPILVSRCIECHGQEKQRSGLRLDSPDAIRQGSKLRLAVVAGKPEESRFYTLLTLPADHKDLMPSVEGPLAPEQVELIRRWIVDGATFEGWTPELAQLAQAPRNAAPEVFIPRASELPQRRMEFNRDVRPISRRTATSATDRTQTPARPASDSTSHRMSHKMRKTPATTQPPGLPSRPEI